MTAFGYNIAVAPLLSWAIISGFAAVALIALAFGAWRRARGIGWRLAAFALLLLILVNPSLVEEDRQSQHDVAAIVVDESPSMRIGDRRPMADAALDELTKGLAKFKDLDVRVVHAGAPDPNAALADTGTQLYTALAHTLADVPRQRVAGAIMITDGQVHDMPLPAHLALDAPLHVLLTGKPGEADRRLIVKDAPSFGLVGKEVQLTVRVEDLPEGSGQARLSIRKDGGPAVIRPVPVGRDVQLTVAGPTCWSLKPSPGRMN
jgi:hypothetical protein